MILVCFLLHQLLRLWNWYIAVEIGEMIILSILICDLKLILKSRAFLCTIKSLNYNIFTIIVRSYKYKKTKNKRKCCQYDKIMYLPKTLLYAKSVIFCLPIPHFILTVMFYMFILAGTRFFINMRLLTFMVQWWNLFTSSRDHWKKWSSWWIRKSVWAQPNASLNWAVAH